jgi:c(7)-type cytochrome triheme protein
VSTCASKPSGVRKWLLIAALPAVALFATPILAVSTPQEVRIPPLKERAKPTPALFSHWRHNAQHCYSCHPSVFPQAALGFTHEEMLAGRYCGSCHDGQIAKATNAMRCEVCHAAP